MGPGKHCFIKAAGIDEIPAELFKILDDDDAIKVLHVVWK